ncbi:MAG: hypothetical protein P4M00_11110 [Azospirillaceae bacterium]|nr:hypothetical protein [Azospirillaceae bacterium]
MPGQPLSLLPAPLASTVTLAWGGDPTAPVSDAAARLWRGLPTGLESPALRRLARRLLRVPIVGNGADGHPLAPLKVAHLAALGDFAGVAAVVAAEPALLSDESAAATWADTLILAGQKDEPCARMPDLVQHFTGSGWVQRLVFCQLANGQTATAVQGVATLHDQGLDDPAFFTLVDALQGGPGKITTMPAPLPIDLALLLLAHQPVPVDALPAVRDPVMLRAIALSPGTLALVRAAAGERAAVLGSLDADELAKVYAAAAEIPAGNLKEVPPSSHARAVFQHDLAQAKGVARGLMLPLAFRLFDTAALVGPAGTLLARALDDLPLDNPALVAAADVAHAPPPAVPNIGEAPTAAAPPPPNVVAPVVETAPVAASALGLVAGRWRVADPWYVRARTAADATARKAAVRLWPLAALTAPDLDPYDVLPGVGAWIDAEPDHERAAGILAVMAALGEPAPDSIWERLVEPAATVSRPVPEPSPALWHFADHAAMAGDSAVVALATVAMYGNTPPWQAPAALNEAAVSLLRRSGLLADARALAREAALTVLDPAPDTGR